MQLSVRAKRPVSEQIVPLLVQNSLLCWAGLVVGPQGGQIHPEGAMGEENSLRREEMCTRAG